MTVSQAEAMTAFAELVEAKQRRCADIIGVHTMEVFLAAFKRVDGMTLEELVEEFMQRHADLEMFEEQSKRDPSADPCPSGQA
jgi:hypothetical protein